LDITNWINPFGVGLDIKIWSLQSNELVTITLFSVMPFQFAGNILKLVHHTDIQKFDGKF